MNVHSLQIVLEEDVSEEEAERLITVITSIRGVAIARPMSKNVESVMAEARARRQLVETLSDCLRIIAGNDEAKKKKLKHLAEELLDEG